MNTGARDFVFAAPIGGSFAFLDFSVSSRPVHWRGASPKAASDLSAARLKAFCLQHLDKARKQLRHSLLCDQRLGKQPNFVRASGTSSYGSNPKNFMKLKLSRI
jgi:hypothetical protein